MWLFDHLREDARGSGYRALRPVSNYSRQWKVVAPGAPARRRDVNPYLALAAIVSAALQ